MTRRFGPTCVVCIAQNPLPSLLVFFLLFFTFFLGFKLPLFERQGFGSVLVLFVVIVVNRQTVKSNASGWLRLATQNLLDSGLEVCCEGNIVTGVPKVAGLRCLSEARVSCGYSKKCSENVRFLPQLSVKFGLLGSLLCLGQFGRFNWNWG